MILATIKNFSYEKKLKADMETVTFSNVNDLKSRCFISINKKTFSISKWVSPKRTRSYPYSRVYDTFDEGATKTVTIIPIIKDEGLDGDMDYLQWDTVSFMSLLGIYVVIGYYDTAERNTRHARKPNKITGQEFNNQHIQKQLFDLTKYHQSALHWNLKQLDVTNLEDVIQKARAAYKNISNTLGVQMHPDKNIDKFMNKIIKEVDAFRTSSRNKAKLAQVREVATIQPKEAIGIGKKTPITIVNYLGGNYFFTIDDLVIDDNIAYLIESKHSKTQSIPSIDDIKDGLLKLMLYNNLDKVFIDDTDKRKVVLRLTSSTLKAGIKLPETKDNIDKFIELNTLHNKESLIHSLNEEAKSNKFDIWFEKA